MLPEQKVIYDKLNEIFFPLRSKEFDKVESGDQRLVHYTTAENAINIIKSKTLWLRNVRTMNDWSEVDHGYQLLRNYFQKDNGKNLKLFKDTCNRCHKDSGDTIIKMFDSFYQNIYYETYISCLSLHEETENIDGRLSMWRAYSVDSTGVALVLKTPPRYSATPLNVFLHPVAYADDKYIERALNEIISNITENTDFLTSQGEQILTRLGYIALLSTSVSLKHPGFKEEQEWRLIHVPQQFPSDHIKSTTEVVKGIPQQVYKMKLENNSDADINNIDFSELFDRVIITQTPYASSIIGAFKEELYRVGVNDPGSKIFLSTIPIRK